ncbi:MAG: SoxR reducing system RseC family protein [Bacteroidales bacterium]|nr:SoxR reducing system RseC family protein [Bacteroidales bacterium]
MNKRGISGSVQHIGKVEKVDPGSVTVKIVSESACSGCHAKARCSLTDSEEKIVFVTGSYDVTPGDTVTVLMKQSMGYKALLIGYVIPFLILLSSLVILAAMALPEAYAGLLSIGILALYYLIIYIFRNKIDKKFTFTLMK